MALYLSNVPNQCLFTHDLPKLSVMKKLSRVSSLQILCSATGQGSAYLSPPESRRSAHYQPAVWSHEFVESLKKREERYDGSVEEVEKMDEDRLRKLEDQVRKLEDQVRKKIQEKSTVEPLALLEYIDDIQRLGLGYRFEKEIKESLDNISSLEGTGSLHHTALRFRILKQHGYKVSQDVFESFTDGKGGFKACLCKDVKGMLSLYEASYVASEGETLLHDEAMAFTKMHLEGISMDDKRLDELVNHAMELPLHRRMPRLEARWFIEAYTRREDADDVLLELAILDFNLVQSTLQDDLQHMSKWWKETGLANKLPFARNRLMECFFWTMGMAFEPEFSNCRRGLTKVTSFITTIDDVYDIYGSINELELFTDIVERWDISMMNNLPDYMKLCFLALYNSVNEMAYDALKEHGHNTLSYLSKAWADLFKAFLVEAQWCQDKYTPTFKEYLENGWHSVSGAEIEREESANSISCYMHEAGVPEEEAREHIRGLIDESWRKMNKVVMEMQCDSPFAKAFVDTTVNLARIAQCTYQHGDAHSAPDGRSKKQVLSLIIEPIPTKLRK